MPISFVLLTVVKYTEDMGILISIKLNFITVISKIEG